MFRHDRRDADQRFTRGRRLGFSLDDARSQNGKTPSQRRRVQ